MSARWWAACMLAAVGYGVISTARTWRRERALTEKCRAKEQAKTADLVRRIAQCFEAHKTHRAPWRRDPDGMYRCPQCDPHPPTGLSA